MSHLANEAKELEALPSPSKASFGCSDDYLLRQHGFRIFSRPKGKEAIWEKNGRQFDEPHALAVARRLEQEKAVAT